ncbi:hypothetical protein S1OALGB6SA_1635 [Olavius algarvensis spirochete endosymbiont]|uniref:SRPBCC family protein n=1 Tax=Olavius algarvensis spirochete endosymbiont TaxID=260710 RepID=UPI000F1A058B|nr:SRPBCC family protein [Olavius algarvensis spirochete endosymbiont]CAD7839266.1 MAG: hypothetical protein [Olavius algarvensis spirochete endosymbiont]VDB00553.1 hypothetical protein S1OALGB6SA_1635 [Olavius algarvensis spirochete endosymbiont]
MKVQVNIEIQSSAKRIWESITNFNSWQSMIRGIEELEILNQPREGLVGLKWKETRTLFGKPATEIMWITAVEPGKSYTVNAESHGARYITKLSIEQMNNSCRLIQDFQSIPQTLGARILAFIFGAMGKKSIIKAFESDLADIKAAIEDSP